MKDHVTREHTTVGTDTVNNEATVFTLGFCQPGARDTRIDVKATRHIGVCLFPEIDPFLTGQKTRVTTGVIIDKRVLSQECLLHPVTVSRKAITRQARSRHFTQNLIVGIQRQTRTVLGREIGFTKNVGIFTKLLQSHLRFFHTIRHRTTAVGIDVSDVKR